MTIGQLRELYYGEPFRPFVLILRDGSRVNVKKRECIAIAPGGEFAEVVGVDSSITRVVLADVVDVQVAGQRGPRRRSSERRRKAG